MKNTILVLFSVILWLPVFGQEKDKTLEHFQLGQLHYKNKEYDKAEAVLQKVVALKKHRLKPVAEYWLAFVEREKGKAVQAAKRFGSVAKNFPQHELAAHSRLMEGETLLGLEQFPAARKSLKKYINDHPIHKNIDSAYYMLGSSWVKEKQWAPALKNFAKVPQKSEWHDEALYESAWCQKYAGKMNAAVVHYERLLALFPESPLANNSSLELAELEFEARKYDDVIKRLLVLIAKKPEQDLLVLGQYRLGWAYFKQDNFAEAAEAYEAMLLAAPEEILVNAPYQAGESRLKNNQPAKALLNYLKAFNVESPKAGEEERLHMQALVRMGECQASLKRVDEAIFCFKIFEKLYPESDLISKTRRQLGELLLGSKQYKQARAVYVKLTADKDPFVEYKAWYYLAWIEMDESNFMEADKLFAKVVKDYPEHDLAPNSLYLRAIVKIRRKDYKGVVECLTQYREKFKDRVTRVELENAGEIAKWAQGVLDGEKIAPPNIAINPGKPIRTDVKGYGTGFFITSDGFILTNYHVVEDAVTVSIKIRDKEIPAEIIKFDKKNDLAVLKVKGEFKALPLKSSKDVGLLEEVITAGFPRPGIQGFLPKSTRGFINSKGGLEDDPTRFQIDVHVQPGNSGGPLIDTTGNVVGVIVGTLKYEKMLKEKKALPQNVNFAIKSSIALAFLKPLADLQKNLRKPTLEKNIKLSELAERAVKSTCLIIVR